MTVKINGQTSAKITNFMGWIDDEPVEFSEVAFCITDFSKSDSHESIISLIWWRYSSIRIAAIGQYILNMFWTATRKKDNYLM
jgi:hypothetical protein